MNIEILYFDECPNHGPTVERVKEALRQEGRTAQLVEVNVRDEATAQAMRFLGSPTVQIDGMDIEATARSSKDFGVMCRTYGDSGNRAGIPPINLIRAALRETAGSARRCAVLTSAALGSVPCRQQGRAFPPSARRAGVPYSP